MSVAAAYVKQTSTNTTYVPMRVWVSEVNGNISKGDPIVDLPNGNGFFVKDVNQLGPRCFAEEDIDFGKTMQDVQYYTVQDGTVKVLLGEGDATKCRENGEHVYRAALIKAYQDPTAAMVRRYQMCAGAAHEDLNAPARIAIPRKRSSFALQGKWRLLTTVRF